MNVLLVDAAHQGLDFEQFGPDPIHGRNQAPQHVVSTVIFPGALHRQQIAGIGHHADLAIATLLLAAEVAERFGGKVETTLAFAHLAAGGQQGIGKGLDLFLRLAQQVQG